MKPKALKHVLKGFSLAILLTGLPAFGQVTLNSSWTGTQTIPDNNPSGVAFQFNLGDPATVIQNVSVTLNLTGGYNGDIYAYLSHGSGFSVLLNRVGRSGVNDPGYGDSGFAVTLSGNALGDIHQYQSLSPTFNGGGQLTGVWAADGRNLDPASAGSAFDTAPRNFTLSNYNGLNPNGAWTLFLADRAFGEISTLNSYSVAVTAVPEPAETGLVMGALFGLAAVVLKRRNKTTKQDLVV